MFARSSWILPAVVTVGSLLGATDTGTAGVLQYHSVVLSLAQEGYDYMATTTEMTGDGALDTGYHAGWWDGYGTVPETGGAARAVTAPHAGTLLRVGTSSYGVGNGLFAGSGIAVAAAGWGDVAYVSGISAPDVVRLYFSLEAWLGTERYYDAGFSGQDAALNISLKSDINAIFQADSLLSEISTTYFDLQAIVTTGDGVNAVYDDWPGITGPHVRENFGNVWDSWSFDGGGRFTGTFHLDTPYDADIGGYAWSVIAVSQSIAFAGSAYSDAMGTLKFTAVTDTEGNPLDVTFESGLRFANLPQPVPEPSSLALLGIGGLIGGVRCVRRRRA